MNEMTIYHNPRCSKSRQTLALLEAHGVQPKIVLYLENPLSAAQIKALLKKLGISARALLRKGEAEYRELNLAEQDLKDVVLIAAMAAEPKLIERPIVVKGARAVLGRPPENVLALL